MTIARLAAIGAACMLAACLLTACSSLSHAAAPGAGARLAMSIIAGPAGAIGDAATSVSFTIKVPSGSGARSASISVNGGVVTIVNLSSSSPGCTAPGGGHPLTCTATLSANSGFDLFAMATFSGQNGSGSQLANANIYQKIAAGGGSISTILSATPASVALVLANVVSLECAPASTIPLYALVSDSSGDVIVGAYGITIALSDMDATGITGRTASSVTSSSDSVSLTYNGKPLSSATITASGSGIGAVKNAVFKPTQVAYVSNYDPTLQAPTITSYSSAANGNAKPLHVIAGSNTTFDKPNGLALSSGCTLYVGNSSGSAPAILEFAATANGNTAPTGSISGSNTGLGTTLEGLTFDSKGRLWVGSIGAGSIEAFAAGAHGNATPVVTIAGSNTGLNFPSSIAFDAAGNIYVADFTDDAVLIFGKNANGNVAPTATIGGSNAGLSGADGVAVDSKGKVYVTSYYTGTIAVFAKGATGNVAPIATLPGGGNLAVLVTHAGAPVGLDAGGSLNFYAVNPASGSSPARTIAGSKTRLYGCSNCSIGI